MTSLEEIYQTEATTTLNFEQLFKHVQQYLETDFNV